MATGDAAAAAGMDLVDGATTPANTIDTEINKTRDYIAAGAGAVAAATPNKVVKRDANGRASFAAPTTAGHAATKQYVDDELSAAAAELQTDIDAKLPLADVIVSTSGAAIAGKVPRYDGVGRIACGTAAAANQATPLSQVQSLIAAASPDADADQVTSAAYSREVGSNRYAMWMDGGRWIGRSSSSRRRKSDIEAHEFDTAALLSVPIVSFVRDVDAETGTRDIGLIAEDLADAGLSELVYTDDDGQVDGIHDHRLVYALLAVVQRQAHDLDLLAQRLTELEDHHADH